MKLLILMSCVISLLFSESEQLRQDNEKVRELSRQIAKIYSMPEDCEVLEITENVLSSPILTEENRKNMQELQRKVFLFTYPSDGLRVKGFISFVPHPETKSSVVLLRGGNRSFGILMPCFGAADLGDLTVIATSYRGSVCEGREEFGGDDLNDVNSLLDFIPTLEKKLSESFLANHLYMVGCGRGAMQMFLSFARFPEMQNKLTKAVSISGMLDIELVLQHRPEMKDLFIKNFGLIEGVNEEEWMAKRNPMLVVPFIKKDLPILLMHGKNDQRAPLALSTNMLEKLTAYGCQVEYQELDEPITSFDDPPGVYSKLVEWLKKP